MVYTPSIAGELDAEELKAFKAQSATFEAHEKAEKAFIALFTANLIRKGFVGTPWVNLGKDKVSAAMDDGKGASKKALVAPDAIDWVKASAVLKTVAAV